jgi:hypothetical protein
MNLVPPNSSEGPFGRIRRGIPPEFDHLRAPGWRGWSAAALRGSEVQAETMKAMHTEPLSHSFPRRILRTTLSAALAFLALGVCSPAGAEPTASDRAAAEALFAEGGSLYQAGRYQEACAKLADSQRLDPAPGTLLNLARCYQKLGQTATAWLTFLDAAAAARNAHNSDREKMAKEAAAALAPTLPKLTIVVPQHNVPVGIEVKRDGTRVPPALWNSSAAVDPGDHEIVFTATGKKPWSTHVRAEPSRVTQVTLPVLEKAPNSPGARTNSGSDYGWESEHKGLGAQRTAALVTAGLGVVGVGVGSWLGLAAISDRNASNERCSGGFCTQEGLDDDGKAHDKATGSTIAFAVGGAALVVGAVLWFAAPSRLRDDRGEASQGVRVGAAPAAGGGTLLVTGAW